jgi:acetyltransferase
VSRGDLAGLFRPRSVAFVGASSKLDTYAGRPLAYTKAWRFPGRIYPVNPSRDEIAGFACFPTVAAIPDEVDLAVLLVPASVVPSAVEDCAVKGVKFCLVIASGFADAGEEGRVAQDRMSAIARSSGMRIAGPNSAGLVSFRAGLVAKSAYLFREPVTAGGVAFITQSGSLSTVLNLQLDQLGVRYSHILDTGNEADLGFLEVAEYLLEDPDVELIAGYVEAFHGGERLVEIGRKALKRGVPIVLLGPQNPLAMGDAVRSHTGNVMRSDASARRAIFEQAGIIATASTDEFCDLVTTLSAVRGTPKVDGVGIVSGSGGAGILLADAAMRHGLTVPELGEGTRATLRSFLPAYASAQNPVDVTGAALDHPNWHEEAIAAVLADPAIDVMAHNFGRHHSAERVLRDARAVVVERDRSGKPMLLFTVRSEHNQAAIDLLREAGIPVIHDTERLARALAGMRLRARALADAPQGSPVPPAPLPRPAGAIADDDLLALLSTCGVPTPAQRLAATEDEAVAAAAAVGYPVALKVVAPGLLHKTELGGVRLGIGSEAQLTAAYRDLVGGAGAKIALRGVLVQEMVTGGLEVVLGFTRNSDFGPVAMFGLGGTLVELLRAVSFRGLPLTDRDAERLIDATPVGRLADGYRGSARLDRSALVSAIRRAGDVFLASAWMDELDLNPIVVLPDGRGVRVVDAAVVTAPDGAA